MKLTTILAPTVLPVELESVKNFCRVLDNDEDAQVELMIRTALHRAEDITNLTLNGVTTFKVALDGFKNFKFPKNPLLSVEKIEYIDSENSRQELSIIYYDVDETVIPGICVFKNTPPSSYVEVTFKAGYVKLPPAIESWLNVEVSTLYEHREQVVVGASVAENKRVDRLLDSFRIIPV